MVGTSWLLRIRHASSPLEATATGLEGRRFREPPEQGPRRPQESHCSAFAATGSLVCSARAA